MTWNRIAFVLCLLVAFVGCEQRSDVTEPAPVEAQAATPTPDTPEALAPGGESTLSLATQLEALSGWLPSDVFIAGSLDVAASRGDLMALLQGLMPGFTPDKQQAYLKDIGALVTREFGFDPLGSDAFVVAVGESGWMTLVMLGDIDVSALPTATVEGQTVHSAMDGAVLLWPMTAPKGVAVFVGDGNDEVSLGAFLIKQKAGKLAGSPMMTQLQSALSAAGPGHITVVADLNNPVINREIAREFGSFLKSSASTGPKGPEAIAVFMEGAAKAVEGSQGDCAARQKALQAYIDQNASMLDGMTEDDFRSPAAEKRGKAALEAMEKSAPDCQDALMGLIIEDVFMPIMKGGGSRGPSRVEGLGLAVVRADAKTMRLSVSGSKERVAEVSGALKGLVEMARGELQKAQKDIQKMDFEEALMVTLAKHLLDPVADALLPKVEGDDTLVLELPSFGASALLAVVGAGAAVSIPLVAKGKVEEARHDEAYETLKYLGDGAIVYFQEEHMADPSGLQVITKVYPLSEEWTCTEGAEAFGARAMPTSDVYAKEPWKSLRFSISKPHAFRFCYKSSADQKAFVALAEASFDDAQPDTFYCVAGMSQDGQPIISAITEAMDRNDCEMRLK